MPNIRIWLKKILPQVFKPTKLDVAFANLANWYKNNADTKRWQNFEKNSDILEKEYNALLDEMRQTPGVAEWLTRNVTWGSGQVIFSKTKLLKFLGEFGVVADPVLVDMIFPPTA